MADYKISKEQFLQEYVNRFPREAEYVKSNPSNAYRHALSILGYDPSEVEPDEVGLKAYQADRKALEDRRPPIKSGSTIAEHTKKMRGLRSWMDWGIDEDSAPYLKKAYMQSLTGMAEQWATGEARYKPEEYDDIGFGEDLAATVLSMAMPGDILAFWLGGKVAQGAIWTGKQMLPGIGKSVNSLLSKGVQSRVGQVMNDVGLSAASESLVGKNMFNGATHGFFNMGFFGGTHAYFHGHNEGKRGSDLFKHVAGSAVESGLIGSLAGMTAGGMMGKRNQLFADKKITNAAETLLGPLGQIPAETLAISAPHMIGMAVNGVAEENGMKRAATMEDYGQLLAQNFATVASMKAWGSTNQKIFKPTKEYLKAEADLAIVGIGLKKGVDVKLRDQIKEMVKETSGDPDYVQSTVNEIVSSLNKVNKKIGKGVKDVNEALAIVQEASAQGLTTANFTKQFPKVYDALMVALGNSKKMQKSTNEKDVLIGKSIEKQITQQLDILNEAAGVKVPRSYYTKEKLEARAKELGIDISKMSIEDAKTIIKAKDEAYAKRDISESTKKVDELGLRDLKRQGIQEIVKDKGLSEQNKDQLVLTVSQKVVNALKDYVKFIQDKGGQLFNNMSSHENWIKQYLSEKVPGYDPAKTVAQNKKVLSEAQMKKVDGILNKLDSVFSQTTTEVGGNPTANINRFNIPLTTSPKKPIVSPALIKAAARRIEFFKGSDKLPYQMSNILKESLVKAIEKPKSLSLDKKTKNALVMYAKTVEKDAGFRVSNVNEKVAILGTKSLKNAHEGDVLRWIDYVKTKKAFNVKEGLAPDFFRSLEISREKYQGKRRISDGETKQLLNALGVKEGKLENIQNKETFELYNLYADAIGKEKVGEVSMYGRASNEIADVSDVKALGNLRLFKAVNSDALALKQYALKAGKKAKKGLQKVFNRLSNLQYTYDTRVRIGYENPYLNVVKAIRDAAGEKTYKIFKYVSDKKLRKSLLKDKELAKEILSEKEIKLLEEIDAGKVSREVDIATKTQRLLYDNIWETYKNLVSKNTSKKKFKRIMDEVFDKYLEDYTTNIMTTKAKDHFLSSETSKSFNDYINKNIETWAKGFARSSKENGGLGLDPKSKQFKKKVKELIEDPNAEGFWLDQVKSDVYQTLTNSGEHYKISNKFLLERLPTFDALFKGKDRFGNDKVFHTYEVSGDKYLGSYVRESSKHLAAVELLPEFTEIGKKYKISKYTGDMLELLNGNKNIHNWVKKSFETLLRINPGGKDASTGLKATEIVTTTGMMMGLSSPYLTSAVKNIAMGLPQIWGHYGTTALLRSSLRSFNPALWKEAKKKGVLDVFSKQYYDENLVGRGIKMTAAQFMRLNGMKSTENWMRLVAFDAARYNFETKLALLRSENVGWLRGGGAKLMAKMGPDSKKKAHDWIEYTFENKYMMSKGEINFLKTANLNSPKNLEQLRMIHDKVDNFGHQVALGGTSHVMIPAWMGNKKLSPVVLFQKLAASKTNDFYRNFVKPVVTHQNPFPAMVVLAGSTLAGKALVDYYQAMLHMKNPFEGEDGEMTMKKAWYYLWRAEGLQLAGGLFNPYTSIYGTNEEQSVTSRMADPLTSLYMNRILQEGFKMVTSSTMEGVPWQQTADRFLSQTVTGYGHLRKVGKKEASRFYKESTDLNLLAREWGSRNVTRGYERGDTFGMEWKQPYTGWLRDAFYFGTDDEVTKSAWGIFNANFVDAARNNKFNYRMNPLEGREAIWKSIKGTLQSFNPVAFLNKEQLWAFKKSLSPEKRKKLEKFLKQHYYRVRVFERAVNNYNNELKYAPYYLGTRAPRPPRVKF